MTHVTIFDHLFAIALLVLVPLEGSSGRRRLERAVAPGGRCLRPEYRRIVLIEWAVAAIPLGIWMLNGRPLAPLGISAPSGARFFLAFAIAAALTALLARQIAAVSRPEIAARIRHAGQSVAYLIPRTDDEFRTFISVGITAGIVEELVYRGFMLWYLSAFVPLWAATILSSLLFGLAHTYQGPKGIPRTAFVGLAFAWLYVLAGSLWIPMALHALVDILQVQMVYRANRSGDDTARAPAAA